eukprot:1371832-Pleurochrysis_carterae.AAC.3
MPIKRSTRSFTENLAGVVCTSHSAETAQAMGCSSNNRTSANGQPEPLRRSELAEVEPPDGLNVKCRTSDLIRGALVALSRDASVRVL